MSCFLDLQPVEVRRALLPFFFDRVVSRSISAEYVPGAGCCRKSGIAIVMVLPLILPCRTALAIDELSTNSSSFLPTYGVTVNASGAGVVANGFTSAFALPEP